MLTAAPQIYGLCFQNLWLALISFVDALPSLEEPFVIDWLTHSFTDWWFLKSPYLSLLFGLAVIWSSTIQSLINWSIHQFIHKCAAMCKILTYFVNFKQSETKDMLGRIQTFHKWSWKFCSLAVTEGFWRFPWHLCRDISKMLHTLHWMDIFRSPAAELKRGFPVEVQDISNRLIFVKAICQMSQDIYQMTQTFIRSFS